MGVITRSFFTSTSTHVHRVINSKFGNVEIPNLSLPEFIWKEHENWIDLPAIVSINLRSAIQIGTINTIGERERGCLFFSAYRKILFLFNN